MQINTFNGGINTILNPCLLQQNEAREAINMDINSGVLKSSRGHTKQPDLVTSNLYWFNSLWIHSPNRRTYTEFQDNLYYSADGGVPQKTIDGIAWYNLGILMPVVAPTLGDLIVGELDGTYQFCYTYYNSIDGTESKPSYYTAETALITQGINLGVTASTDPQVDLIRIYRLGGNLTAMSLDREVPNTTATVSITTHDANIVGFILESFNYGQAPENLVNLTEANAMFFGSVGNILYYTDIGKVNAWSPFNFIEVDAPITGIGNMQNGLLVFTKYKTYIVTGNAPDTLSKYLLNASQGCLCHTTIRYVNNLLVWLSTDGICSSSGNDIQVISKPKLGKLKLNGPFSAIVLDEIYYLGHSAGVIALDSFNKAITTYSFIPDSFAIKEDELYYSASSTLFKFTSSSIFDILTYHSPDFHDGSISTIKNYKSFYVSIEEGIFNVIIYIDGKEVAKRTLVKITEEIKIPQDSRQGYYISFKIQGQGIIRELEYKVEGRQNGR